MQTRLTSESHLNLGTAAWTIPKEIKSLFPETGSHLERYSSRLNAVEINTSFYRDHKAVSYERWAASVPEGFKFSVKLSNVFTHEQKLKKGEKNLKENLNTICHLKNKLGCLLIQLPPSLSYVPHIAESFFSEVRDSYQGPIALEPRQGTWDQASALALNDKYLISRVIADPEPYVRGSHFEPAAASMIYFRLHGSPEIYKSKYEYPRIQKYAERIQILQNRGHQVWCIFDNTTFGFATSNALELSEILRTNIASV